MEEGEIQVDSITPIGLPDITSELARESGFLGIVDLLKVAKHGNGTNLSDSVPLQAPAHQTPKLAQTRLLNTCSWFRLALQ